MSEITLDESQNNALTRITEWLNNRIRDPKVPQVFRLGGFAGSGKTTIIREVISYCEEKGITFELGTPSGKAASVLQKKGLNARTIHALFLTPNTDALEKVKDLNERAKNATGDELKKIRRELQEIQPRQWIRRESIDSDLIIVDEASMVGALLTEDLLSYGVPVLAVGDPAQLGPVQGGTGVELFAGQTPDAVLDTQHRFGGAALLGSVADAARANEPIPEAVFVDIRNVDPAEYDVVLVATNKARWEWIHRIREAQGLPLDKPIVGDHVMFWRNNNSVGVYNGQTAEILEIESGTYGRGAAAVDTWDVLVRTETGEVKALQIDPRGFKRGGPGLKPDEYLNQALGATKGRHGLVAASFCEAITVHKAQGSEWGKVLVVEALRPWAQVSAEECIRWRYTAVTRASQVLGLDAAAFRDPVKSAKTRRAA